MKKKRIFVLSVDALVTEDIPYLKTKEHLGRFFEHASGCESIRTVYPSVTYPAHVAMASGCYPDRSGIPTNGPLQTDYQRPLDWYWDGRDVRCDTIFAAAKRAGYSTCSAFWPVTCNLPEIDYNMPEYWLYHPGETLRQSFLDRGSSEEIVEIMERNACYLVPDYWDTSKIVMDQQPEYDDYIVRNLCEVIRRHQPEVILMHLSIIDTYRHQNGIFGPKITEGLDQVDVWWGQMMQAFTDAGVYDDTDFFIVSDHGQMDIARRVKPNAYLVDRGFITLGEDGRVTDWTAYGVSTGMSMFIWVKDHDPAVSAELKRQLDQMAEDGIYGFTKVFTREETARLERLDGDFDFVLETDGFTGFGDRCDRPWVANFEPKDYRLGKATHGYLPDKGPQPVFFCKGPHIEPDVWLPRHSVVDEAPTYAKLLGTELKDAQGTAMTELLR